MKFDSRYDNKKTLRTTIIALLIVSALLIPAIAEINTTGTYFWISPVRNIYADPTENIEIAINVANAPETFAWGLKLEYDDSVLSLVTADEGDWLTNVNSSTFFSYLDAAGTVIIEDTFTKNVPSGASGDGWLCNVTFTVDTAGRSGLNLKDTYLLDMDLGSTDYPNNDGFFCANAAITGLHDVYIVDIWVDSIAVQQDDPVNITVEIHNEGDASQTVDVTVYADLVTHDPEDPDTVAVGDEIVIHTFTSVAIAVCQHINLSVIWNTAPVAGELWTISAEITKVDGFDDNDLHDNILIGPSVLVKSIHDIKITDKTILTPSAKRNVMINFTAVGGAPVTVIAPCQNYTNAYTNPPGNSYDGITGLLPPPSTWWHIVVAGSAEPYEMNSVEFHVDSINKVAQTFHIDKVILPDGTEGSVVPVNPALWVLAEQTAKIAVTVKNEGKVEEDVDVYVFYEDPLAAVMFTPVSPPVPLENCTWLIYDPMGPLAVVEPCTWWHIIESPDNPDLVCKEFHIDMVEGPQVHVDFVWPDEGELVLGPIVALQEKVIGKQTVHLAQLESKTIYFHWLGLYSTVPCGEYTITAFAYPVPGEEMKNWIDNKYVDGTIEVQFSDVKVQSLRLLTACTDWDAGVNPTVVPEIVLNNTGCQDEKLVVYYIADPNLAVTGDEIVFGLAVVGPIHPGETITFVGASPFGGWDRRLPSIAPPYNVPVPGTNYSIIAKAVPAPGFEDDDMSDNTMVGIYGPPYGPGWQLPVVTHDLGMYIFKDLLYWEGQVTVVGTCLGYGKHVYKTYAGQAVHSLKISVTVFNQGTATEDFTVTLQNGTGGSVIDTEGGTGLAPGANTTVTLELSTLGLTAKQWYTLIPVVNVTITGFSDDDPCDNCYEGYSSFYVREWGDVNNNNQVGFLDFGDVGKMYLIYSGVITAPFGDLMGDLNANCQIGFLDFGDVGKMYLIYSGVLP